MRRINSLIVFLIFSSLILSCTKENEINNENSGYHVIGNRVENAFYHKVFDPVLQIDASRVNSRLASDSVDLDNDGIKDIRFESYVLKPKRGYSKNTQFVILNKSIQIPFVWINNSIKQSSYQLGDTLYNYWYDNISGISDPNSSLSTLNISRDHPRPLGLNDSIFFESKDNFRWSTSEVGEGFILSSKDSVLVSIENESQILGYRFDYRYEGIWNNIGAKFLPFKIEKNSRIKFGWIRLEVLESMDIKIYEIACF